MRAEDIYTKPTLSMKDIDLLKREVSSLERVTGYFNIMHNMVVINFTFDGLPGILVLEAKPEEGRSVTQVLTNKLTAVARTQLGGKKPRSLQQITQIMQTGIGNRALQILLNGLSLRGARYREIKWNTA